MAEKAETLLDGSGWLPEPLRTPGRALPPVVEATDGTTSDNESDASAEPNGEELAEDGGETAIDERSATVEDEPVETEPLAIAAE